VKTNYVRHDVPPGPPDDDGNRPVDATVSDPTTSGLGERPDEKQGVSPDPRLDRTARSNASNDRSDSEAEGRVMRGPRRNKRRSKRGNASQLFRVAEVPIDFRKQLRSAADDPESLLKAEELADAVLLHISRDPGPRGPSRKVSLGHRIGAILKTHCSHLPAGCLERVRGFCHGGKDALRMEIEVSRASVRIPDVEAARLLGIEVAKLRRMCCDPSVRYAMGWPVPLGDCLLFLRGAVVAAARGDIGADVPATDPVRRHLWPEGWR